MDARTYNDLMDGDSLYSIYSPRRSDTSFSSSSDRGTAASLAPPSSTPELQHEETDETLVGRNSFYSDLSDYSARPPGPFLQDNNTYGLRRRTSRRPMVPEVGVEAQAAQLAQQLGHSHISNGYATDASLGAESLILNDYYRNQEAPTCLPVNPYEAQIGTTNNTLYGSYCLNHDQQGRIWGFQGNPSLAGLNVPVNPYQSDPMNGEGGLGGMERNPRFLRNQGETDSSLFLSLLQDSIRAGDVFELMKDKHGNYGFQNFLRLCDLEQKKEIVIRVSQDPKRLVEVATDPIGRVCFNSLIAAVKTSPELCDHLMAVLSTELFDLISTNRNWLPMIGYLLDHLGPDYNSHIFKVALKHFDSLSKRQRGVLFLNQCLKKLFRFDDEGSAMTGCYRNLLLIKIVKNSVELAADTFGNFVVQCVVDLRIGTVTDLLCKKLKDHVQVLALSKSGSYVLQKCLKSSAGHVILEALVTYKPQILHEITMHRYGNYVMQTAMDVLKELPVHAELVQAMRQLPQEMKCHPMREMW